MLEELAMDVDALRRCDLLYGSDYHEEIRGAKWKEHQPYLWVCVCCMLIDALNNVNPVRGVYIGSGGQGFLLQQTSTTYLYLFKLTRYP
jgi:hypothetical protein